ncbi:MAG: bifunctional salicylyl-CoA 5-hydroxylase/oxidoreductase [Myxococcota bacterium]
MRIVSVGGGPAGLYFSILMKKLDPSHHITVLERNRPDDTFGWGVVFSDETLGHFEENDAETLREIRRHFVYWKDIDVHYGGTCTRSTGHGFCGLARIKLLQILQARARELGVELQFEHEVTSSTELPPADLILVADGINSRLRTEHAEHFQPQLDWRKCKFTWLGTDKVLPAFTFIFKENEHGLFQVHAYPFDRERSTFIVECREETWKRAGLEHATDEQTVAYMERLFASDLGGHRLLSNRSIWRTFPTVRNARWHHRNMVLMGDAAHTAHFSIGSGTKLAMEDAIALRDAFLRHGTSDIPRTLAAYQQERQPEVDRLQKAAQTSLEWFENTARYTRQSPLQFTFNLMTRSKRITYDNLARRDPELVGKVTREVAAGRTSRGEPVPPIFMPYRLRGLELPNRMVVSPMCQYSAVDGTVNDWHLVHLGSRAVGGAGLVIAEATAVSAEGRITPGCAGMYAPEHVTAWKRVVDFVHTHSRARMALQLGHAGRKASCHVPWEKDGAPLTVGAWPVLAPSPVPYDDESPVPREMDRADLDKVIADFVRSAQLAQQAGFDMLELHLAHGYLLNTFLSPLTNRRTDAYGGSLRARLRFPTEVLDAVRAAWPTDKPISARISATEWAEGGFSDEDRIEIARTLHAHGCDIIDCSAGGVVPEQRPIYGRMFQVHLSDQIRHEAGVPTMTVGNIQDADQCNTIVAAGRADLCVLARAHLANPYLTLHAAAQYGYDEQHWPNQYLAAKPTRRKGGNAAT